MAFFSSEDQEGSCLQVLAAAITDSVKIGVSKGVPLRRSLAEFVTFTTRLKDEMEGSTPEQLEYTLKSINYFHRALDMISLERIVHASSDTDNVNKEINRSDSMDEEQTS
ncbi:hypothetical protein PMAYCL1PPCAC_14257 [Pristionchus mayeri]|uniref:Uncharacterized protein n=1 Tax=Pristionchus mayeri TaxID=1317129 RepID=A0AAN4ZQA4_9BILA|nr:hypothetical protein PMAYCL1PPCAC_14257 [Pristionchus mayeri]